MSGFDDLPGFGAPPPFLQARAAPQGGFGFDAPGFAPAPPSAPAPFGFEAPQFPGLRPPHQHHHQQQQQQQHHQHHAQHQHQQQPTQGSLFGAAPMIGGNGRHQYTPRTFDLPEQTNTGFNAPAAAPQYGGHAAPPQPRFPPASANRDTTNTVWLGFQESFTSDDDLRNHFSQFGKVLRVQRNQAKNCVFVHFLDVDEARRAVESPSTRQFLGPTVKVSYGRMFTYDAEELERMERFEQARANRGGGGGGFRGGAGIGYGEEARDASGAPAGFPPRGPRDAEPTNIVWVGDVTPDITDELLRINFGTFGRVVSVFRSDAKGMAFVHLETVEEAGRAIRGLRSVPIGGKILKLNYGRPQVPRPEFGGGGQQFDRDDREPPTNVVWIGMLAPTVTQADIDALLVGYEGFIDADLFPDRAYSFAHFETIEQAVKCRNALRGQSLHNAPLRVGFGKNNHNRTRADRFGADATAAYSGPAYDQYGMPLLQAPLNPTAAYNNGTLITTVGDRGQLSVLPAEGAPTLPNSTALVPKYVNQPRPTPQVTVDSRVQALGGCSYFKCNVPPPHLMQPAVKEIVEAVDNVTSYNTAEQFLKTLRKYDAPTTLPHLFTVIAKRLKDYHMDDPHKKLHVAYSVALLLHEMPLAKSRSSFDAFCTLLSATSAGQCADGAAHLARLMKSFRKYLNPDVEADALILGQFEHIDKKQRADSDVNNLLKKLQANK